VPTDLPASQTKASTLRPLHPDPTAQVDITEIFAHWYAGRSKSYVVAWSK